MIHPIKTLISVFTIILIITIGIYCFIITEKEIELYEDNPVPIIAPPIENVTFACVIVLILTFLIFIILKFKGEKEKNGEESRR